MKNLTAIASLAFLAACGISEESFAEKYADKFCEVSEDLSCGDWCGDTSGTGTTTATTSNDCDFDSAAAKDCLNGEWTCNSDFDPILFPEGPAACLEVYDCGTTGTGTGTGTTTTTSGT